MAKHILCERFAEYNISNEIKDTCSPKVKRLCLRVDNTAMYVSEADPVKPGDQMEWQCEMTTDATRDECLSKVNSQDNNNAMAMDYVAAGNRSNSSQTPCPRCQAGEPGHIQHITS
ncbi:hypothetical protein DPMN_167979 [Dreissena polymorpha]|uniref:Uncharacterized protein n=1 Tax=Dreissena polymorpha TaxID=45954 RepID=A0A9D4F491_DREPO|nr:hypothetical protein DPMN_167979 [Dreissena polymorpha]